MVTVLVQFPLPEGMSADQFAGFCRQVAPDFRNPPGLVRKQFLIGSDGRSGGGAYLWESRAAAEQFYGADFRARVAGLFGTEPVIQFFRTPVVVDNRAGTIDAG
ncbi:MAG TPA: YdhR family protein [Gemmataceae bacterium]|nr:YdhR family protein [Gemmataceae bacterium]